MLNRNDWIPFPVKTILDSGFPTPNEFEMLSKKYPDLTASQIRFVWANEYCHGRVMGYWDGGEP